MEFIIDPNALDQDVANLTQPRFLRKAVTARSPGGTLTTTVAPGVALPNAVDAYRARATDLYRQGSEIYNADPDTTQLQQFAKQRGDQGDTAMLMAMAAQAAGEQFAPFQEHFLKKAVAAKDPIKLGAGLLTAEGQYIKDPFAAQDKKAEFLLQQARAYEALAQNAETARERLAAQRKQEEFMNEFRLMGLNMQGQNNAARQQLAREMFDFRREAAQNKGEPGHYAPTGFTPDGQPVVTNSKSGMSYVMSMTPDGRPTYAPHMGQTIPKATFEKNTELARTFGAKANSSDALIAKIDQNPGAFGFKAAAISKLPPMVQGRVGAALLDDKTLQLRADVLRQAAMEISDIYGAAQSIGEAARAATFIPSAEDPPDVVIGKLRAARDYARNNANAFGGAINRAADARSAAPAPAAGGAPTPGMVKDGYRFKGGNPADKNNWEKV